jgi:hypothetical protein
MSRIDLTRPPLQSSSALLRTRARGRAPTLAHPSSRASASSAPRPYAVHRSQALGASEHLFVALRRFTPINVARVIALEGQLASRDVLAALRALQARHPLLRARIVDGDPPRFVYDDAPPLCLRSIVRRHDEHWREHLETLLNQPLASERGAAFEVHYLHTPRPFDGRAGTAGETSERSELILVAEHAICDGVSMNNLCAELLELCARGTAKPARATLPVLERLLPAYSSWTRAVSFGAALARFGGLTLSRALFEERPWAGSSSYTFMELSAAETRALVQHARAEQTTVTGCLMSAVALTLQEVRPRAPRLAISVPINLRPRIPERALEPDDLGNYTSVAYLSAPRQGSPWDLARELKARLDRAASPERLLPAVGLIYRSGRAMVRPRKPPLAHAMISNSGVVSLRRDYGSFRPVAFRTATSAPMLSADFSLFCNTLHDRLTVNLIFSEEVVPRSAAEQVLARIRARLTAL